MYSCMLELGAMANNQILISFYSKISQHEWNQFLLSREVEMCFDKLPGKDSVCFVSGRWISQTRQEGMERKKMCFRSTAFLCSLRSVGTETQGETLKGRLRGMRNSERKNSEFFSLPYSRCFTYIIACNIIDISIFYFTNENPESQWGHRDDADTMLRADTLHSWTSHPGLPVFEAH